MPDSAPDTSPDANGGPGGSKRPGRLQLPPLRLPDLAHLRLAARATIAGLLAYAIAMGLELPKGYWAVLSAILVVQSSIGASVAVAVDRGLGTVAGGVIGVALALLAGPSVALTVALMGVGIIITALLAAYNPSFKLAPVTIVVVMLADPTHAQPVVSGFQRVLEIGLGGIVGVGCALLVFPTRALGFLFPHAADALDACALLLEQGAGGLLEGTLDPAETDRINGTARQALRQADVRAGEARRERAGRLSAAPDPMPVVRMVRRLWHSVIILLRVADRPLPESLSAPVRPALQAAFAALAAECRQLAASLRSGEALVPVPDTAAAVAALVAELDRAGEAGLLHGDGASLTRLYTAMSACTQVRDNLQELAVQLASNRSEAD